MARAAVLGRLTWLAGQLTAVREETATARTLVLDVPGWAGHLPGPARWITSAAVPSPWYRCTA